MKQKIKSNSGFTLVELIIAMAILAFLMTAISSLMGTSVLNFSKTKADIRVQTSAQDTYNKLTDTIMQANNIVLTGYTTGSDVDFTVSGKTIGSTSPELYFFVRDKKMKQEIISNPSLYGTDGASESNVKLFSEIDSSDTIYVKTLRIETSVPIDLNFVPGASLSSDSQELLNSLTGEAERIERKTKSSCVDENGNKFDGPDELENTDAVAPVAYNRYDTLVNTFTFSEENLYYEKKYAFMTELDDVMADDSPEQKKIHLYNKSFSYVETDGCKISGCIATVDADAGAMGIDFVFNDKNMTYTTIGMVNTRNSYVFKAKK